MNHNAPTPKQIAKYSIEKVLGRGAMGVVYKAYDSQIERPVAIKVLHEHLRQGEQREELESRFLQEAKAAARCLHPNIVTVFDFGVEGVPYIVMEFVEGTELRSYLKSDMEISLPSATDMTIQILRALVYAHSKGVVHRDIKPENIILLVNGTLKVSDFGVARLDKSDLTSTGFMVGTPNYMSPEGLQGRQVDSRSDLFSVGVVFYELLTRTRFSRDLGLKENLEKLHGVPHLTPKNVPSIQAILRRALRSDPRDRYATGQQFIEDLQRIEDMDLTLATMAYFPQPTELGDVRKEGSSYSTAQWNDEVLLTLEQSLARFVGPMARLLVKKDSRTVASFDELVGNLAEHIPNENERRQFFRNVSQVRGSLISSVPIQPVSVDSSASQPTRLATSETSVVTISLSQQKVLAEILAFYTGPIARRLVAKLAKRHLDLDSLIGVLANEIPDDDERRQFVRKTRDI